MSLPNVSYRTSFSLADERIERSLDVVGEHAAKGGSQTA
jgi:hypothetical protein